MADLRVSLCGVELKNPVIPASGTFGFGREFDEIYDISCLGGVATKGLTPELRLGNPVPRIAESRGVILNAVGLQNPGVESFIKYDLDWLKSKTRVVANVAGKTLEDYKNICARLDGLVEFIELNISCPNVKCGGMAFGIQPESVEEVTNAAKSALKKTPLIVKLSPNVESIANNARAAERGGADCLSLVNTFTGMAIDIERRKPIIANNTGGVSGAGIKPIAVRMVYEGGARSRNSRDRHGRDHVRGGCDRIFNGGRGRRSGGHAEFYRYARLPQNYRGVKRVVRPSRSQKNKRAYGRAQIKLKREKKLCLLTNNALSNSWWKTKCCSLASLR